LPVFRRAELIHQTVRVPGDRRQCDYTAPGRDRQDACPAFNRIAPAWHGGTGAEDAKQIPFFGLGVLGVCRGELRTAPRGLGSAVQVPVVKGLAGSERVCYVLAAMKYLTPQQDERFQRDGFLVVESFLSGDEVRHVRQAIERVCTERVAMTRDDAIFNLEKVGDNPLDTTAPAVEAGRFRKITGAAFHVPAVRDVFTSKKMLDCMEDIMGPDLHYHSSKVMFKSAGGGAPKPWHQDAAYWKQFLPNQITVWIAIDDATEQNGCVWAVPGSHKLGLIPHVKAELQVEESRIDLKKAAPVPVRAGGLLIFHSLVLHMSKKNESNQPRWAIICDYDPEPNPAIDRPKDGSRPPGLREDGVWPLRQGKAAAAV